MEWRHTVWPEAELVYTSIAKVANSSVKEALQNSFQPEASTGNPHSARQQYRSVTGEEIRTICPDYLHIALVRNPFDRFVSFYQQKIAKPQQPISTLRELGFDARMSFDETVKVACAVPDESADIHMRSQSFVLLDGRGRPRPDLLLRFERIERDWQLLQRVVRARTGAGLLDLPHLAMSKHATWPSYYSDETRKLVYERYRTDFELLGYGMDTDRGLPASQPAVDDAVGRLVAEGARGVLDLSLPSDRLLQLIEAHDCLYLGLHARSCVGQLVTTDGLRNGHIPESLFDVLVLPGTNRQDDPVLQWLRQRFESTGRSVLSAASWEREPNSHVS